MDTMILWFLLFLGFILFGFIFRKPPIHYWLFTFLLTSYCSTFIGVIVVEKGMLEYPIRLLADYFESSILYEYLLFPIICVYFCQYTYDSTYRIWVIQAIFYNAFFTLVEIILEHYTDLIHYYTWTWLYTFISTFALMVIIRTIVQFLPRKITYS
jgi:hypothetical protein